MKIENNIPNFKIGQGVDLDVSGDVEEARIGDIILAFGNPYGLGLSVSQGIISAKYLNAYVLAGGYQGLRPCL